MFSTKRLPRHERGGIDLEERATNVSTLLEHLSKPETVSAAVKVLEVLPRLVPLIETLDRLPDILATLADVVEDYQQQCAEDGIDIESALANGLKSALWLGSQVDAEHLRRMGELLGSEILNEDAIHVVDSAARSLSAAQADLCKTETTNRVGMFGLLGALRNPKIQRSLAFAVRFGECFGNNIDAKNTNHQSPDDRRASSTS